VATRTAYTPVALAVLTASDLAKLPGGWLGDVQATAAQTGVTAQVDATSLTLTVTVGTSRRILVSAFVPVNCITASGRATAYLMEGATQLQVHPQSYIVGDYVALVPSVTLTPSAGSHTYKVQLAQAVAGSLSTTSSATQPAWLRVDDIGPAA
jgi:hypothetical protein